MLDAFIIDVLRIASVALMALGPAPLSPQTQEPARQPPADTVVVVLFDGFAADLLERHATPELDRLAAEGAASRSLEPAFPSVSLVNGVTLSTGCWPARHGIVGNRFRDPVHGLYDHDRDADWLLACEHLHEAVERQNREAAVYGWYGARSGRDGPLASRSGSLEYSCEAEQDERRLDEALTALAEPTATRPALLLVYLCGPDHAQHFEGEGSAAEAAAVAAADGHVGRVRRAIEELPDGDRVALAITTDHGMTPVSTLINITRILRGAGIEGSAVANDGMAHVYLDRPASREALRTLAGQAEFDTHLRATLPAWMNLGRGPRVGDLVLVTEPPYFFADVDLWPWHLRFLARVGPRFASAGGRLLADHGYDSRRADMQGILVLWGAGVAAGAPLEEPRAVDLHPTVMALLGLQPLAIVDGRPLLAPPSGE